MAAKVLRPKTAPFFRDSSRSEFCCEAGQEEPACVELQTKVGDSILAPGLRTYLEKFCDSAQIPKEKAKALELLTSMDLAEDILHQVQQQPQAYKCAHPDQHFRKKAIHRSKTSVGFTTPLEGGGEEVDFSSGKVPLSAVFNPYQTSYKTHYPRKQIQVVTGKHPGSTKYSFAPPAFAFQPPQSTTYNSEFGQKFQNKETPYNRTGSASGNRNHNPHPSEEFMNWRYPRRRTTPGNSSGDYSATSRPSAGISPLSGAITNEEFDRAIRGKYESTYHADFTGMQPSNFAHIPQPFQKEDEDPRRMGEDKSIAYTSFRDPKLCVSDGRKTLRQPPTTRYASNSTKLVSTKGVVPGVVSEVQLNLLPRTTYDLDVNEPALQLYGVCQDIRSVGRKYAVNSLQRIMRDAPGPAEKRNAQNLIQSMEHSKTEQNGISLLHPQYDTTNRRGCISKCPKSLLKEDGDSQSLTWISNWPGPL